MNCLKRIDAYGDGTFDIFYEGPFAEVKVLHMSFGNNRNITVEDLPDVDSAKVGTFRVRVKGTERYPMTTVKIARLTGMPLDGITEMTHTYSCNAP